MLVTIATRASGEKEEEDEEEEGGCWVDMAWVRNWHVRHRNKRQSLRVTLAFISDGTPFNGCTLPSNKRKFKVKKKGFSFDTLAWCGLSCPLKWFSGVHIPKQCHLH